MNQKQGQKMEIFALLSSNLVWASRTHGGFLILNSNGFVIKHYVSLAAVITNWSHPFSVSTTVISDVHKYNKTQLEM